ncbi:glycosyltransferase family 2 protein [Micromonospora thermarum]|uniref:Glycosyltransferase family 2 protein n=1 Tax=Micromonospora thermarum TaxID=2720024 RepID=A0ABX0Z8Q5_9ACTN|nr:glycosyltransferase family 2 protein [Micromonospora thermarum]NJP32626.1 glycosyltransferase family 2 protein [Micromonospora thermarum]
MIVGPRTPESAVAAGTAVEQLELSVVMPCLNEAETLAVCIRKARESMRELGIAGEVVVSDNGSTDGSQEIALAEGARVVHAPQRGYGAALRAGIAAAEGTFVIMADADDSYALHDLGPFVERMRAGADLVIGNRFKGGIERGAMPPLHRFLGNPVLSFLGRTFFGVPVGDFHCGMRGFRRDRILELGLRTSGMEFASEMVARAALAGLVIDEVPTTLAPDGRSRRPHLRTWRDGWRHLRFLLALSPRWMLLYPGLSMLLAGGAVLAWLLTGTRQVGQLAFDLHTMLAAATAMAIGIHAVALAVVAHAHAIHMGLIPPDRKVEVRIADVALRYGVPVGSLLLVAGVACFGYALWSWGSGGFSQLDVVSTLRLPIVGVGLVVVGVQSVLLSFIISLTRVGDL